MRYIEEIYAKRDSFVGMLVNMGCREYDAEDIFHDVILKIQDKGYYEDRIGHENRVWSEERGVNFFYIYKMLYTGYIDFYKHESRAGEDEEQITDTEADVLDMEREIAKNRLHDKLMKAVDSNGAYCSKLLRVYFGMSISMRRLSSETGISLSSIFNSIKNYKHLVKQAIEDDYRHYQKGRYDRI